MVLLRPITKLDSEKIVRWRNSDEVKKYLFQKDPITIESHLCYYKKYIETGERLQFIIYTQDSAGIFDIGCCFVKEINYDEKTAEIGIFIGEPTARGKGYAKYALSELIRFAFEKIDINILFLYVLTENTVAIALYEKMGFSRVEQTDLFIKMILNRGSFVPVIQR